MAKFLLVTHIYPPAVDGGSKVIYKLGQYFKQQGHEIMVLTSDAGSTDDFTHPYRPIQRSSAPAFQRTIFRLPVYTLFHRPFKLFSKVLSKGPIFKFIPFIEFLIKCLKFRPDYIIAGPLPTTIILYARLIRFLTSVLAFKRSILLINASFHPTDTEFHQPLLINTLQSADFIWTLTDFETKYFHQNFNFPLSKMINVGNGVDHSFLSSVPAHKRTSALKLIYIGSFAAHKGINTLIDAFSILSSVPEFQRTSALTLTLAGQKTLYQPHLNSKIKIIYNFKSSELANLLDQSSILISPSTQESFGLVIIEALARGIPVIAANIPASAELINKTKGGLLFEPGNSADLAAKILSLQRSRVLTHQRTAFHYVQSHYTWDKIGDTIWQKISSSSS